MMTPQEFRAWFDGYCENIENKPSQKQWDRIKSRVGEMDGQSTSYLVFLNHYWRPYWTWPSGPAYPFTASTAQSSITSDQAIPMQDCALGIHDQPMSSTAVFAMLGQVDAQSDG
jgi:hypothetical protein